MCASTYQAGLSYNILPAPYVISGKRKSERKRKRERDKEKEKITTAFTQPRNYYLYYGNKPTQKRLFYMFTELVMFGVFAVYTQSECQNNVLCYRKYQNLAPYVCICVGVLPFRLLPENCAMDREEKQNQREYSCSLMQYQPNKTQISSDLSKKCA